MTDLVTGEAVVLELRLAKLASRLLSLLIDLAVQMVLLIVGLLVIGGLAGSVDDAAAAAIFSVFVVAVIVGYPVAFETLTRGRTLGKMALGLRVVREDGGPIRFRHALVRGLAAVIEIWLTSGAVALIVSLASSQGKRLGDFLAGTIVVRERVPSSAAPMIAMPPPLAWWASGLDLSRLPDDLALAARQFLSRSGELAPEVRESMGARLAGAMAACTSPPPPPGVPPWAFMSAVLAERRRREALRLTATRCRTRARRTEPRRTGPRRTELRRTEPRRPGPRHKELRRTEPRRTEHRPTGRRRSRHGRRPTTPHRSGRHRRPRSRHRRRRPRTPPAPAVGSSRRPRTTRTRSRLRGSATAGWPRPSARRARRRPPRRAAREQAAAEERALERAVAVHAAATEAGHLARGVDAGQWCAVGPQHAGVEVGLEAAERLAGEDRQAYGDQRSRFGIEQAVGLRHPDQPVAKVACARPAVR